MIDVWVELSGENASLATAEALAVAEALGGGPGDPRASPPAGLGVPIAVLSPRMATELTGRLALAYRCLAMTPGGSRAEAAEWLAAQAVGGDTAAFRPVGEPTSSRPDLVPGLASAWKGGGGRIDLRAPQRRFWFAEKEDGTLWLGEELATVDRRVRAGRRMPRLPFQRPISLPPQLGRVAANLARIRPGDRVVDPFVGTGALLVEAALLGARVSGGDRDASMIRGAMANFAHLGVGPELLKVVDAGEPFPPPGGGTWDAVVTDPPYGRSSASMGEAPDQLLARAMRAWAALVRPRGWLSLVAPTTAPVDLGPDWSMVSNIADRVHRSLTREFRTYRRADRSGSN